MARSDQKSLQDRVAVLEERCAKLEEGCLELTKMKDEAQENRRAVIPDEVWNSPEFRAYRARNARISLEIMLRQMKDAQPKIEEARLYAADKCAVEEQQKGMQESFARKMQATFELATEEHLRAGATVDEANLLAAVSCYENFRDLPPGYQIEYKPDGVNFTIRRRYVS